MRVGGSSKAHPLVRDFLPDLAAGISGAPISERPHLAIEAADRLERLAAEFPEKAALVTRLRDVANGVQEAFEATGGA